MSQQSTQFDQCNSLTGFQATGAPSASQNTAAYSMVYETRNQKHISIAEKTSAESPAATRRTLSRTSIADKRVVKYYWAIQELKLTKDGGHGSVPNSVVIIERQGCIDQIRRGVQLPDNSNCVLLQHSIHWSYGGHKSRYRTQHVTLAALTCDTRARRQPW